MFKAQVSASEAVLCRARGIAEARAGTGATVGKAGTEAAPRRCRDRMTRDHVGIPSNHVVVGAGQGPSRGGKAPQAPLWRR